MRINLALLSLGKFAAGGFTMHIPRQDRATAGQITEALRIKTAFGQEVALAFLRQRAVPDDLALAALADRYERRTQPDHSSSLGSDSGS